MIAQSHDSPRSAHLRQLSPATLCTIAACVAEQCWPAREWSTGLQQTITGQPNTNSTQNTKTNSAQTRTTSTNYTDPKHYPNCKTARVYSAPASPHSHAGTIRTAPVVFCHQGLVGRCACVQEACRVAENEKKKIERVHWQKRLHLSQSDKWFCGSTCVSRPHTQPHPHKHTFKHERKSHQPTSVSPSLVSIQTALPGPALNADRSRRSPKGKLTASNTHAPTSKRRSKQPHITQTHTPRQSWLCTPLRWCLVQLACVPGHKLVN